jgi:hypothetical protein
MSVCASCGVIVGEGCTHIPLREVASQEDLIARSEAIANSQPSKSEYVVLAKAPRSADDIIEPLVEILMFRFEALIDRKIAEYITKQVEAQAVALANAYPPAPVLEWTDLGKAPAELLPDLPAPSIQINVLGKEAE